MYELVYNLLIITALLILLKLLYPSLGLVRQDWKNRQKALAATTISVALIILWLVTETTLKALTYIECLSQDRCIHKPQLMEFLQWILN